MILITGGAGFIGKELVSRLLDNGNELRVLDVLSNQVHGDVPEDINWLRRGGVQFIRGSVTSRRDLLAALDGVEIVVHLAAETGTAQSMYEIDRYNHVNVGGTSLLLDILANTPGHKVKRIVCASSRSIYGEGAYFCANCETKVYPDSRFKSQLDKNHWEPICPVCGGEATFIKTCESSRVHPASIYAATKYMQEELVRIACESQEIDYSILRLQNVYGEGQSLHNPYTGILSIFSTKVRRGLELPIFEDGKETRDFVHVKDVVSAICLAVHSKQGLSGIYNVGSGVATTVSKVAELLISNLGGPSKIRITGEYRLGDIRHNVGDLDRIGSELGYKPRISLEEGIKAFCQWVLSQPLPEDQLDKANSELKLRNLMY